MKSTDLSEPVRLAIIAALGTILAAAVTAFATVRAKIQETAWRRTYEAKRADIEAFTNLLSRFGHLVHALGEMRAIPGPLGFKLNCCIMWTEQTWPKGRLRARMEKSMALAAQGWDGGLPKNPAEQADQDARALMVVTAFGNAVMAEALGVAHELATLQGRLLVTVRNPNVVARAMAVFSDEFANLVGMPPKGIETFPFAGFPQRYSNGLSGPRRALGRELRISTRSLRAATSQSRVHSIVYFLRAPVKRTKSWWDTYYGEPEMFRDLRRGGSGSRKP